MSMTPNEKRVNRRLPVAWDAECRLGGSFAPGIVRDISAGGVFFATPDGSATGADVDLRIKVEMGDQVILTYETARFAKARRRLATVAWVGPSSDHGCVGLGLRFDEL